MQRRFGVPSLLAAAIALALCGACGTTIAGDGGGNDGASDSSGATDSGSGSSDNDSGTIDGMAGDGGGGDPDVSGGDGSSASQDTLSDLGGGDDTGSVDTEPTDTGTPDAEPTDAPFVDATGPDTVDDGGPTDATPPVDGGLADVPPPPDGGSPDVPPPPDSGSADVPPPLDGGPADVPPPPDGGSLDVPPPDAGPAPGCCNVDGDCKSDQVCFFGPMKAGRCMNTADLGKGLCWTNGQCGNGETCVDAMVCGCNAICKAMDKPGVCKGPVAKPCSIGLGADVGCGLGEYCALPGTCSGEGVCTQKPDACIMLFAPVCGCDGKTYGNSCEAAGSGVNVKGKGECEAVNPCMWMKCGDGNACTADQCNPKTGQCEFPPLTGEKCDDGSLCTYGEVCAESGGKAYCKAGNEVICPPPLPCQLISCNAKSGQCETKPDPACGGEKKCSIGLGAPTIDCGPDGFCQLPGGTCVGFGLCAKKPFACLAVYNPVCGCDGNSYGNDCEANSNGENWGSKGKCDGGGGEGCCKDNSQCKTGLCAGGMCKDPNELKPGLCWNGEQCKSGKCIGASICPCGAACFAADSPGKCADG